MYGDESFINQHITRRHTVVDLTDTAYISKQHKGRAAASVPSGAGKGRLHIVVHCMSEDGVLAEFKDGRYTRSANGEPVNSAGVLYLAEVGGGTDDATTYHRHWDNPSCDGSLHR